MHPHRHELPFAAAMMTRAASLFLIIAVACFAEPELRPAVASPAWTSPNGFRLLVAVDARGRQRSDSPASLTVDFQQLARPQRAGRF
jgi:hypothetical protein